MTNDDKSVSETEMSKSDKEVEAEMGPETTAVFTEIYQAVNDRITEAYQEMFEDTGGANFLINSVPADRKNDEGVVQLDKIKGYDLPNAGADFRIIPELLDSMTERPVRGEVVFFTVQKRMRMNITSEVRDIQRKLLSEAAKKMPDDEFIKLALDSIPPNEEDLPDSDSAAK